MTKTNVVSGKQSALILFPAFFIAGLLVPAALPLALGVWGVHRFLLRQ